MLRGIHHCLLLWGALSAFDSDRPDGKAEEKDHSDYSFPIRLQPREEGMSPNHRRQLEILRKEVEPFLVKRDVCRALSKMNEMIGWPGLSYKILHTNMLFLLSVNSTSVEGGWRIIESMKKRRIDRDPVCYEYIAQCMLSRGDAASAMRALVDYASQDQNVKEKKSRRVKLEPLVPTTETYNCLMKALLREGKCKAIIDVWSEMCDKNIPVSAHTICLLVTSLARDGQIAAASSLLARASQGVRLRDPAPFSELFCAHYRVRMASEDTLQLEEDIMQQAQQTMLTRSDALGAVIDGLLRAGLWQRAVERLQQEFGRKPFPIGALANTVEWLCCHGHAADAWTLIQSLRRELVPRAMWANLLRALANEGQTEQFKVVVRYMKEDDPSLRYHHFPEYLIALCKEGDVKAMRATMAVMVDDGIPFTLEALASAAELYAEVGSMNAVRRMVVRMKELGHPFPGELYARLFSLFGQLYAAHDLVDLHRQLYHDPLISRSLDQNVYFAAIDAYGKCGWYAEQVQFVLDMQEKGMCLQEEVLRYLLQCIHQQDDKRKGHRLKRFNSFLAQNSSSSNLDRA